MEPLDSSFIAAIVQYFQLGEVLLPVQLLEGGYSHKLWRLTTNQGCYVIKQLALPNEPLLRQFRQAEIIASHFQQAGIASITALAIQDEPLFSFADQTALVYPWQAGAILTDTTISTSHAITIAQLLAKIHSLTLPLGPALDRLKTPLSDSQWSKIRADWESSFNNIELPFLWAELSTWRERYQTAWQQLEPRRVLSHGDIYQPNVIWTMSEQPVLIDWENAGWHHPGVELLGVIYNWSGITGVTNDWNLATRMWQTYQQFSSEPISLNQTIIDASLGSWLDWLAIVLQRIIDCQQHDLSNLSQQLLQTVRALRKIAYYPLLKVLQ